MIILHQYQGIHLYASLFAICPTVEDDEYILAVTCARNYFAAYRSVPNAAHSS
jgi:hypothetical protein